ncbi:MAG: hypothetical protein Q9166_004892 [cf. Caloplaca sp. 2 TL-2023]
MGLSHSKQKAELELDGDGTTRLSQVPTTYLTPASEGTSSTSNFSLVSQATPQQRGITEETSEPGWLPSPTPLNQFERMLLERVYTNSWVEQPIHHKTAMMSIDGKLYSLLNSSCFKHKLQEVNQLKFPEGTQLIANQVCEVVTYQEPAAEKASGFTVYKSSTSQKLLNIPDIPAGGKIDLFYPLGYLVEPDDADYNGRITNFVWALNLSTEPVSLWLIYDYVWEPYEGEEGLADLEQIYTNWFNYDSDRPYTEDYCDLPKGFLNVGRRWDIVQVYDDIGSWHPCTPELNKPNFEMAQELGPTLRVYRPSPSHFGL